ncbi:MAG: Tfp pilus assembly protein FimT/FimU [Chthoniobacterales bacterium]
MKQHQLQRGFTLIELTVVIAIVVLLTVLVGPAFNSLKSSQDITNAVYRVKGAMEQARAYALVNNTYVWIGFFEENGALASTKPPTVGTGRVVICTVASKDGTTVYNSVTSPATDMDSAGMKLVQIGNLLRLGNAHLRTFALGTADGSDTLTGRPTVPGNSPDNAQIGDVTPPDSLRYFHYPPGKPETMAEYTFKKMLQFSPRGECRPQNDNYALRTIAEVGLQPSHGGVLDDAKSCVVQVAGFSGNMKVYRR